jgi:pyruvate kinase
MTSKPASASAAAASVAARRDFRLTKIVCTLGPASSSWEAIEAMARAGMNVARLNFSHGNHATHLKAIQAIRGLNRKLNHPIAVLLDTQGPEIRTGEISGSLDLKVGETFTFTVRPEVDPEQQSVHVNYQDLAKDLKVGDRVTVDNGLINLQVLQVQDGRLQCKVIDGGKLGSRKHVNLPGVRVNLPSITEKDRADIRFGLQHDVDFLALSFVRSPEDVLEARKLIEEAGSKARIIAKIENREGLDNFDAILAEADGIMVARGDLGVEIDLHDLPVVQRQMVRSCAIAGKPVIVATHLLESMVTSPMPTRAEVTDVANAVYEMADAVMLSGETAAGKHPSRCVEVMDRITRRIEKEPGMRFHEERKPADFREELARAACRLADSIGAAAIVVITRRGLLAQAVASFRPSRAVIYAFTNMSSVRRKLWLLRAVVPFVIDFSESDPEKTIRTAFDKLSKRNRFAPGDQVVVVSDTAAGEQRVTAIQVRTVGG